MTNALETDHKSGQGPSQHQVSQKTREGHGKTATNDESNRSDDVRVLPEPLKVRAHDVEYEFDFIYQSFACSALRNARI